MGDPVNSSDEATKPPIVIVIDAQQPAHPKLCPPHVWAWAYLGLGETTQACRRCGVQR
jgi:hypothetical protein